jgi:hypothetical protein
MFQGFGNIVAEHPEGHAGSAVKLYFDVVAAGFADEEDFIGDDGFTAGMCFPGTGGEAVLGIGTDERGIRGVGGGEVCVEEGDDGAAGKVEDFLGGIIEIVHSGAAPFFRYIYNGFESPFCFNSEGEFFKKVLFSRGHGVSRQKSGGHRLTGQCGQTDYYVCRKAKMAASPV